MSNIRIAANKVMAEERTWLSVGGHRLHWRRERPAIFVIKGLSCARLSVVLLHVASLAVTLQPWIIVLVAWTISVGAIGPLRVRSLNGEASHPFSQVVLDGKRIGNIVASRAHLCASEHH